MFRTILALIALFFVAVAPAAADPPFRPQTASSLNQWGSTAALDLDFTTGVLDPRITFSRGSLAMLTDGAGRINYAPNNLALYNTDLGNAAWTRAFATFNAAQSSSPLGANQAGKLIETSATGVSHYAKQTVTVPSGARIIASGLVKAAGRTFVGIYEGSSAKGKYFNLSTCAVGANLISAPLAANARDFGNGWCLISIATTAPSTSVDPGLFLSPDGSSFTYNGNGTDGIYVAYWQVEVVTSSTTPRWDPVVTTSAAYHGPRFDHLATGPPLGLLLEEQRANLLTYSDQFDNAAWTKANATITANAIAAPDGSSNADLLTASTTGPQCYQVFSASDSASMAASIYLKRGNTDWALLRIRDKAGAGVSVWVNLATGALGSTSGSPITTSISSAGSGWYRVSLAGSVGTGGTTPYVLVAPASANSSTSTAVGDSVYVWGAQVEGGTFALSHIPTIAAPVTRLADVASMTGTAFSSWFNQSEGTFLAEYDVITLVATQWIIAAHSGAPSSTNDYFALVKNSGNLNRQAITAAGVSQGTIDLAGSIINTPMRIAGAYKANDAAASVNGGNVGVDSTVTLPTPNALSFGSLFSQWLNGHMRRLRYWRDRQPNAMLPGLSTGAN